MITIDAFFPVMTTAELDAVNHYYQQTFGFQAAFYEKDFYLHLIHPDNGIQLGFLMPNHETQPDFLHPKMVSEGYIISFEVADVQQAYQQAQDENLKIVMNLKDEAWGQRHFMVQDPAGFHIDVVESFTPNSE